MFRTPWYLKYLIRTVDSGTDGGGSDTGDEGQNESGQQSGSDEPLGENGLKALKAERETNKQLRATIAELNKKVDAFEDKDKTEAEKQAEQLAAAQKLAAESGHKAEQYEVAAAKGIPLSAATRLRGSTREEMEADADELLKLLNPGQPNTGTNPNPPKPDDSQGKGGTPKPASLRAAISEHYQH